MAELPTVRIASPKRLTAPLTVVGCFQGERPDAGRLPRELAAAAGRAARRAGWQGRTDQAISVGVSAAGAREVEIHGLGLAQDFDTRSLDQWLERALDSARRGGWRECLVALPTHPAAGQRNALRVLTGLMLSGYRFDRFKTSTRPPGPKVIRVLPPEGEDPIYRHALRLARPLAAGIALARTLGNTPPNEADPEWMSNQARALADRWGMDFAVLEGEELTARGMGGILAVGRGSRIPARLVRLEWGVGPETVSFVGKGVTFDTGGISIKPARGMDEMKFDKCGACAVLGIARATAELELPVRCRAYLPLVENMPDGAAYRPGDIVRCYGGKTVEILNTDAEGRMILADALAWAAEEAPDSLIELSTLTGASVVALGHHAAALYTPDDALALELQEAGASAGDRVWRMPLWPQFSEEMKGEHGDLRNVAGRWGGANNAASFLAEFVSGVDSWAHLDIAGTAYIPAEGKGTKGATGFGVGLAVNWLLQRTGRF